MSSLANWFESEVLCWRTRAAVAWTCILMAPVALLVSLLYSLSLSHLSNFFTGMTGFVVLMITLTVLNVLAWIQAKVFHRNVHVESLIDLNRMQTLRRYQSFDWMSSLIVPVLVGGLGVYCCLQLFHDPQSDNSPDRKDWILTEAATFLVLHGCFVGVFHSIVTSRKDEYQLRFPSIWQLKYYSIRGQLLPLIYDSCSVVLKKIGLFYILYYLLTNVYGALLEYIPHSSDGSGTALPLSSMRELLSISLLWSSWLTGSFVLLHMRLSLLLCSVYHTEPFQFPVDTENKQQEGRYLHDALACSENPKVQYLACLDLFRLSMFSSPRRLKLFSITPFGGHPVNWTRVYNVCRDDLSALVELIKQYNDCSVNAPMSTPFIPPTGQRIVAGPDGQLVVIPAPMGPLLGATAPVLGGTVLMSGGTVPESRNFSQAPNYDMRYRGAVGLQNQLTASGVQLVVPVTNPTLYQRLTLKFIVWIMDLRVVRYIMDVSTDSLSLVLFIHVQKYIWIIEALSHLVRASSEEDKYGVVQKSLPEIISLFLNLLEAIDKHLRLCPVGLRKPHPSSSTLNPIFALRATLKESLYRIVVTFGHNLTILAVSEEQSKRLKGFIDFRE